MADTTPIPTNQSVINSSAADLLEFTVLVSWQQAEPILQQWEALVDSSDFRCIYSTHQYCRAAWEYLLAPVAELRLIVVRQKTGGMLVAVFPLALYRRKSGGVAHRTLGPLSIEDTDKFYPLIARGYEDQAWCTFVNYVKSERWDVFRWKDYPVQQAQGLKCLESLGTSEGRLLKVKSALSPIIDLSVSKEAFWSQHKKLRKAVRKLEKVFAGTVKLEVYDRPDNICAGLEIYWQIEQHSWKKENYGIGRTPQYLAFYQLLGEMLGQMQRIRIGILKVNNEPVAAEISLMIGERVYFVHGTFDAEYAEYSPGKISTGLFIMNHLEQNFSQGDCLAGFAHYLKAWSSSEVKSTDIMLYRSNPAGIWLWSRQLTLLMVSRILLRTKRLLGTPGTSDS